MAKASKKSTKVVTISGTLFNHEGNEIGGVSPAVTNLIAAAWTVKQRIDSDKKALEVLNKDILAEMEIGHAVLLPGVTRVACVERQTVTVNDEGAKALHQVLGGRYEDLVDETIKYKPLPKLIEMAVDGDNPLANAIRKALVVKVGVNLTYRAAA